jgi:hypothetical protein
MKTQINSDKQVGVDAELSKAIEADVRHALGTFETRLTRLEVHLSDLNSGSKQGLHDKRCLLPEGESGLAAVSENRQRDSVRATGNGRRLEKLLQRM